MFEFMVVRSVTQSGIYEDESIIVYLRIKPKIDLMRLFVNEKLVILIIISFI